MKTLEMRSITGLPAESGNRTKNMQQRTQSDPSILGFSSEI
jgi:hypothetical protein